MSPNGTLTVRLSPAQIVGLLLVGFVGATALQVAKRGPDSIARIWSYQTFWLCVTGILVVLYVAIRLIPAARFTNDGISSMSYPFQIPWADVKKCTVTSVLGIVYLKIYGQRSRFAIWVPLYASALQQIKAFISTRPHAQIISVYLDGQPGIPKSRHS